MPSITDDTILQWLLSLYQSARETAHGTLEDQVFQRLKALIPLSSAVWLNVDAPQPGGRLNYLGMHLFQEPDGLADEFPVVNDRNRLVMDTAIAGLGRAHSFPAYKMYQDRKHAALRHYLDKYGHQNILLFFYGSLAGRKEAFALYRSRCDDHFTPREQRLLRLLAPHMMEAFAINRQVSGLAAAGRGSALAGSRAILQMNGVMVTCGERFLTLLRQRWPGWYSGRVPPELMAVLRPGTQSVATQEGRIVLDTRRLGPYLFVQASRTPGRRLTPLQSQIAALYAHGRTYRQIADGIGRSPATVRNVLQEVYGRLRVSNKAELLQALREQPPDPNPGISRAG